MTDTILKLLADGTLIVVLLVAAATLVLIVPKKRWSKAIPAAIMAGLTSLYVAKIVSVFYQPAVDRPFVELGLEPGAAFINNPGFPSDHVLLAVVALAAVWLLTRHRVISLTLLIVIVAMAIGRVVALVHTPLDIIGGVVFGLAGIYWYWRK